MGKGKPIPAKIFLKFPKNAPEIPRKILGLEIGGIFVYNV